MTINTFNCSNKQNNKDMVIEIKISGLSGDEIGKKFFNISTGDLSSIINAAEKKEEKISDSKKEDSKKEEPKKEEPKKNVRKGRGDSVPKISNAGFLFYFTCGLVLQLMLYMGIGIKITEVPTYLIVIMWFVFTFFAAMICEILKTFFMCIFY